MFNQRPTVQLVSHSGSSSIPQSSLIPPAAGGRPVGGTDYGGVHFLMNVPPLDPSFPRWPIKRQQLALRCSAAGCRGQQGWRR
ncbi:uncharacterized [Tachysurus ichikawai]